VTTRRTVRVDQAFFDDLDHEHFDTLPVAYPERPDYRVLVIGGTLVAAAVVLGQLVADDTIVLLGIELDLDWPDEQPH
jgi:hypothetical protein